MSLTQISTSLADTAFRTSAMRRRIFRCGQSRRRKETHISSGGGGVLCGGSSSAGSTPTALTITRGPKKAAAWWLKAGSLVLHIRSCSMQPMPSMMVSRSWCFMTTSVALGGFQRSMVEAALRGLSST